MMFVDILYRIAQVFQGDSLKEDIFANVEDNVSPCYISSIKKSHTNFRRNDRNDKF